MSFPGEGPRVVGIDRKASGARRRCSGGAVAVMAHGAPREVGIDRKANCRRPPTAWRSRSTARSEAAA